MVARKKPRVAVIYDSIHPHDFYQAHEREAGESISVDAERVRDLLRRRGNDARCIAYERSAEAFLRRLRAFGPDLVFNFCEGAMGDSRYEMNVAALLELAGVPYTGCGPLALGASLDKGFAKRLFISAGIPTPRFCVVEERLPASLPRGMRYPLFVKPIREDASLGIDRDAFITNTRALGKRCACIRRYYRQPALVEEYIEGRELNISIIGNRRPRVLPISEIDMSQIPAGQPRVCDYRAKWMPESREYVETVPRCPAPLPAAMARRVSATALAAFTVMGCRGYARVDLRLSLDGIPYVLEVNPNPCIGLDAGIVRSAGFPEIADTYRSAHFNVRSAISRRHGLTRMIQDAMQGICRPCIIGPRIWYSMPPN
ncbi:MAG: ATP-grasp domain-containing protein [Candidatus Aureabacteria bacterium]|nr:ATP-grasp domain-containing protein [Candidatus Auribacterota bacterium]